MTQATKNQKPNKMAMFKIGSLVLSAVIIGVVAGCVENKRENSRPKTFQVKKKFCVEQCMKFNFSMFHNEGGSWGTGSSSMSGLSQTQIYDRVKKECEEFYKEEVCCAATAGVSSWSVIYTNHSYQYGACKEEKL